MTDTPVEVTLFDPKAAKQELMKQVKGASPEESRVADAVHITATGDRSREDFRVFLFRIWKFLSLPEPTPLQYDIARYLQLGPERSLILGFRGVAKSWITAAYVLWRFYCNPQVNIMVVSGSAKRATGFTTFCLQLIRTVPWLKWLDPDGNQRQSATAFDVRPADPDQNPSLYSLGIGSQLQGFRADLIVPDDIETTKNSMTITMREKLLELIKEFDAILKPGGRITYLGTPQTQGSIYNKLPSRGYGVRIWPAVYPNATELSIYGNSLAPMIRKKLEANPKLLGHSTEPTRFTDEELLKRKLSWGAAGFQLQFMLITRLADDNKYPLRVRDLMVMPLDDERGPDSVTWSSDKSLAIPHLPMLGKDGDYFVKPAAISETFSKWEETIASIDPSGRGEDEAALTVLHRLNSRIFVPKLQAWRNGYEQRTLAEMAGLCVRYRVQTLYIESNFGGGMFGALLRPYLDAAWTAFNKDKPKEKHLNTSIVEEPAARTQKELRILDALEPLTQQHRLILATSVVEEDAESVIKMSKDGEGGDGGEVYSLIHQFSYVSKERDGLGHDDRLDSLAAGVSRWASLFSLDPLKAQSEKDEDRMVAELNKLLGMEDEVHNGPGSSSGGLQSAPSRRPHLSSGRR